MSSCASGAEREDYNLSLHVGALFIILGVSAGACALPLVAINIPQLRIPPTALFIFRHFGTGVLIATAFVHLFPTAFVSLTDPCLPSFFNEDYPAFAGAIALAAVFIIIVAEMIFSPGRSICSGADLAAMASDGNAIPGMMATISRTGSLAADEIIPARKISGFEMTRPGRSHKSPDKSIHEASSAAADKTRDTLSSEGQVDLMEEEEVIQQRKKLTVQCMLLECGILFHSVFIGMALAVAVGSEQVILLIAIAFHQCFEGLALGSRIGAIGWKPHALQPWFMALAYGCTTPLGQAIGIATRNLYDPGSETGLLVVGTMNAISAGLLTYTSLVDLLTEDFLSNESWRLLRGNKRRAAMSLVFMGAFCMSLIGAWA